MSQRAADRAGWRLGLGLGASRAAAGARHSSRLRPRWATRNRVSLFFSHAAHAAAHGPRAAVTSASRAGARAGLARGEDHKAAPRYGVARKREGRRERARAKRIRTTTYGRRRPLHATSLRASVCASVRGRAARPPRGDLPGHAPRVRRTMPEQMQARRWWHGVSFGSSLDGVLRAPKDTILLPIASACPVSPNAVTLFAFALGMSSCIATAYTCTRVALILWAMNRFTDGLDGAVARVKGQATDFGGYLDIVCDFTVYASLPVARMIGLRADTRLWVWVAVLEGVFFVNAASLFCLSAILEKRALGANARGEMTSVSMVEALVGGTESIVLFTTMLIAPISWQMSILVIFTTLVGVTIVQRLWWARTALKVAP